MKKLYTFLLLICAFSALFAQNADTNKVARESRRHRIPEAYRPKFTATVLGRYEYNPQINKHHFELRHTRIGVSGSVHPMFSYMALVDLTYGGQFSPVAIFAQFKPVKGLSFLIGYDKMPFSSENLLSPYQYYFSDKSFLTQKITAWSDVGAVVAYKWDKVIPFEIKAGIFNGAGFGRQMEFQEHLNYVARGTFELFKNFKLTLDYAGVRPEAFRMHHYEVELAYDIANLHLEAEYLYKTYKEPSLRPTHALYGFAYYKINVGKKMLDNIAIGARYDAITANSRGKADADGNYVVEPLRQRLTAGLTFIFVEKPLRAGIRLNYEKNFVHKGVECKEDRIILELITHFGS